MVLAGSVWTRGRALAIVGRTVVACTFLFCRRHAFFADCIFYVPILVTEINSPLAVEGINYVGDTLLFAGTALLAGFRSAGSA